MASLMDRLVVGVLPLVPKPLVGYFSRPYIAGVRAARELFRWPEMALVPIR